MKSHELFICPPPEDGPSDAEVRLVALEGVPAETAGTRPVVARAALWWRDTPVMDGVNIGAIGDFEADDGEAAAILLEGAADYLRERGCRIAVGPMNGNTWQRHRFVVESNGRGPFLLEPRNPSEHPAWWERAGFSVLSRYSSSLIPLDGTDSLPPAVRARLMRSGVVVRSLDPARYDEELQRIHAVSLKSFSHNFLYTPLEEGCFMEAYQKVRERVDPDFVRVAERDGVPCGFVFGISDLEAAARGEKPALIVKTLAVDPESRCAGLGSLLVDELHRIGREKGYTEAIHALQHESNTSLKITGRHHGETFRRYALFSKPL
ncbi:MAG: GNAT family N-acetyltransferase [Verrucomicrobiota bacterium]